MSYPNTNKCVIQIQRRSNVFTPQIPSDTQQTPIKYKQKHNQSTDTNISHIKIHRASNAFTPQNPSKTQQTPMKHVNKTKV